MKHHITFEKYKEIFREYKVPKEIEELYYFQYGRNNEKFIYPFYMDFVLNNDFTWYLEDKDKEKDLLNSIIAFASSDGAGGYFAFWLQEGNNDLSNTPIIHIDSEGGSYLVCKNIHDLLVIMTADLDHTIVIPDKEASDYAEEYKKWAKETFNIDAVSIENTQEYESPIEIKKIIDEAEEIYGEQYTLWKEKFGFFDSY
jgi:hypothetical protein